VALGMATGFAIAAGCPRAIRAGLLGGRFSLRRPAPRDSLYSGMASR
jgi:hypothetical protein